MNNLICYIICSALMAVLFCTGDQQIAGGTTDGGNARIGAVVMYKNAPVAGALVRIRPEGYLAGSAQNQEMVIDTVTDVNGHVDVAVTAGKTLIMEVVTEETLAVVKSIQVFDTTTFSDSLVLAPTASLAGAFRTSQTTGTVKIRGLEYEKEIDSEGRFVFPHIAQGSYSLYIETRSGDNATIANVVTESGQLSRVENIDIAVSTWDIIAPNTFQADSVTIRQFIEKQGIDTARSFFSLIDTIQGRIRTLRLTKLGLKEIHPSIGQCTFLYTVNISENQLTRIPVEIEKCRLLSALLADSNLISEIPVEISRLRFLQFLKFNYNKLTHVNDSIFFLPKLRKLSIGANPVDSLPALIGNLKTLEQLDIFQCSLTRLPDRIGELSNLREIWAGNNDLSTLPESIANLTTLETLQLSSNLLTMLPDTIGNMSNLKTLLINDNALTDLPESIMKLQALEKLSIEKNFLCALSAELVQWVELYTDSNWLSLQKPCK